MATFNSQNRTKSKYIYYALLKFYSKPTYFRCMTDLNEKTFVIGLS